MEISVEEDERPLFEMENGAKKGIVGRYIKKEGVEIIYKLLED